MGPVYALSIHADYRCQHSGVCCTSDWDVPVELPLYRSLTAALASGRLHSVSQPSEGISPLVVEPDLPDDAAAMVARTLNGDCVFYHRHSGLCAIHRDAGEAQLPTTCRHFPRLAVRDRRGTFISLSHYCPTAAATLFREDVPLAIVESPPAFPPDDYDGLVVEPDDWPPLLKPRMLMDADGYSAWERHMVARCADEMLSPEEVLATLERDAHVLRSYSPGGTALVDVVASLPVEPVDPPRDSALARSLALRDEVLNAIPEDLKPPSDEHELTEVFARAVAPTWERWHEPLKRYLAAKAFASWTAYQGRGLLTIVRGLEAALGLVRVEAARQARNLGRPLDAEMLREAFRQADFALNHLAVGEALAEEWSRAEEGR